MKIFAEGTVTPSHAVSSVRSMSVGPVVLAPGITPGNLFAFVAAALIGISVAIFINFLQPLLLSTQLHVAAGVQGRIVSTLSIVQEVVGLLLVPTLGQLADRIGRRPIMAAGLATLGCGLILYPLAHTLAELLGARLVTAAGAAAFSATLATIAADYPTNESRGRLLGILLITQQLAILFVVAKIGANLPRWLGSLGFGPAEAARSAFWLIAALSLLGALVALRGLAQTLSRPAPVRSGGSWGIDFVHGLRRMSAYAGANPRFALVLAVAFVVRGDLSVIGSFLSLWVVDAARHHGATAAEGLQNAGRLLGIITVAGLAAALLTGWLADRYNRLVVLIAALPLAGAAHLVVGSVADVRGTWAGVVAALLGAGEMSLVIAGQALLGQEAPPESRGTAIGLFGLFGSIGVLFINLTGGVLFDKVASQAPFVLIGAIDALIWVWALVVARSALTPTRARSTMSA